MKTLIDALHALVSAYWGAIAILVVVMLAGLVRLAGDCAIDALCARNVVPRNQDRSDDT